jgi:predicted P-loop ATPase/GTPase
MFKRVIWMGMGAAAGSVATVWGQRKVKQQVETIQQMATPAHVMDVAKNKATDLKDRVVGAVAEGIAETRQSEAEMRANLPGSAAVANSVSNFAASAPGVGETGPDAVVTPPAQKRSQRR